MCLDDGCVGFRCIRTKQRERRKTRRLKFRELTGVGLYSPHDAIAIILNYVICNAFLSLHFPCPDHRRSDHLESVSDRIEISQNLLSNLGFAFRQSELLIEFETSIRELLVGFCLLLG